MTWRVGGEGGREREGGRGEGREGEGGREGGREREREGERESGRIDGGGGGEKEREIRDGNNNIHATAAKPNHDNNLCTTHTLYVR